MPAKLRLALAQANFCVGDIAGNAAKIIALAKQAQRESAADVIIFPELAITGYPPEDLLFRPGLHRRVRAALQAIAIASSNITIVVGYPEHVGNQLFNSCAVYSNGAQTANYRKQELPNYSVFDEKRYFIAGDCAVVVEIGDFKVGLSICEDIWNADTAAQCAASGAEFICNINASPYHLDKARQRLAAVTAAATMSNLAIVYVNTVGGQDELIFDGASFCVDRRGVITAQAAAFGEALFVVEVTREGDNVRIAGRQEPQPDADAALYDALVLGVRDYVTKNRFSGCVLGLSGGVDSALTLALAVDALGAEAVTAISMPSRYTANMSIDDAREEAELLGCPFIVIPIEGLVGEFATALAPIITAAETGVTAENVQARCRGVLLMAYSNASGKMVLATGNKSEMSVGYATLYGDMAGGFAPLKDISKTLVYRLCEWRNQHSLVIPQRVLERPPSAELAPDQKDSDSLPPYDILDPILEHYIEHDRTPREIAEYGFDLDTARRVAAMVDRNEYKRRQAAPGVRITKRAFGRDRRVPITSRYDEQLPVEP